MQLERKHVGVCVNADMFRTSHERDSQVLDRYHARTYAGYAECSQVLAFERLLVTTHRFQCSVST